jgi:hypothetical protein
MDARNICINLKMPTKRAKVGENIAYYSAPHRSKDALQLSIVQGCKHACSCIVSWMHDKICIIQKMRKNVPKSAKILQSLHISL